MSIKKGKLKDGLSSFLLTTIVQKQITKYGRIDIYCVKQGKCVIYYMIKEAGYPFLQCIGFTEKEHNEDDIVQIILKCCSFSIDTEYIKNNTQIKFL